MVSAPRWWTHGPWAQAASQAVLRGHLRKAEEERGTYLCGFAQAAPSTWPGCVISRLRTNPPASRGLEAAPGALCAFYTREPEAQSAGQSRSRPQPGRTSVESTKLEGPAPDPAHFTQSTAGWTQVRGWASSSHQSPGPACT